MQFFNFGVFIRRVRGLAAAVAGRDRRDPLLLEERDHRRALTAFKL